MAGMVDTLTGLKENVILGHLIPAGTAFNPHLNLKIKRMVDEGFDDSPVPRYAPENAGRGPTHQAAAAQASV